MKRRWSPSLWASKKPFGIGEQRPNNYLEIWKAFKENRASLGYAWKILNHGVCDGCALGTTGMHDWTLDEIHLCNVRLRLLRLNTMTALDTSILEDASALRSKNSSHLRELGRLPYPMVRHKGEPGFSRVSWDEALDLIAMRLRRTSPNGAAFYMTSRGMPNENYFAVQKAVRAIGTNSIDNAARVCHAPSTFALKEALGVAATTCSYTDLIGTELILFVGSNVASNQPVMMKYLYHAKKEGTKIAHINPYREPGMERYWVPSNLESAIFGTKISDRWFPINVGGDVAFLNGTLKHMIEKGLVNRDFIDHHSSGFEDLAVDLGHQSWEELERLSGSSRSEMGELADMLGRAETAIIIWSMGVTQHPFGEDNVRAIVNLGLARGFVGRPKCGLMPIRGHSGVQGGAEMGAYSTAFPGGLPINEENARQLSEQWGFEVPSTRGMTAPEMIDAAYEGRLGVLFSVGGNFLEVMPDPKRVDEALGKVPLRVHMDIVLSPQMFVDHSDTVILLPATTRYEMAGGCTETSTERRVIFSPEVPGPRIKEARPEWDVFAELARRTWPENADNVSWDDTSAIREDIAQTIPMYKGIEKLAQKGDQFQVGGPHLCWHWVFPTPDGKAHFSKVPPPKVQVPEGSFVVATRRGKQFNSMVHEKKDAITGASRDAVLMNQLDAVQLDLKDGETILLRNGHAEYLGRVTIAPMTPGNLEIHWPEGQVLIDAKRRSGESTIPDYNAVVTVEKVSRSSGRSRSKSVP